MTKNVLITGGSGLVGRRLQKKLVLKGYTVNTLSSRKISTTNDSSIYFWNVNKKELSQDLINSSDYIIHLAGANIGKKRWTKNRKQLIIDSRVKSGLLLWNRISQSQTRLRAFISASAVGYYGMKTFDNNFVETDSNSNDFLGNCCQKWEQVADKINKLGIRTVKVRTGVVLSKEGGMLSQILPIFKLGLGAALGRGTQFMPWIHIDDLCNIYIKAIEDSEMVGAYNAVSPDVKTNKEFSRVLAKILKKSFWLPNIPATGLKIVLGEMSSILLKGSKVSSDKLKAKGFVFTFPSLKMALKDLVENGII